MILHIPTFKSLILITVQQCEACWKKAEENKPKIGPYRLLTKPKY